MKPRFFILLFFLLGLNTSIHALTIAEEQRFTYYFYAAQQNLQLGQYDQAFSALLLCDAINPDDAKVKEQLGLLYDALQQNEVAYQYFKRAYELDPENCWERYLVAERVRCLNANDAKGALKIQDKIDKKKGRDEYSVYLRLRVGELTGMKWKKLVPLYEELLSYNPNNNNILNNYAYGIATHGGDLKKAEAMSRQTLKQEPNNPTCLDTYAWILHLQGQDQLALFYLRKALDNVTDDKNRAVILEHLKAIEEKKLK